jgi:bifunctional enzyme CysN/CysC
VDAMNIVIIGHVDHGKSTLIGRLLADTHSLPKGKIEQVRATCQKNAKPFEYAFLLDALKDEQAQGITIDTARCFFNSDKRRYLILDAPGHIEFLKSMVTGASRAEAAFLVIDAKEGIKENSKRHGYLLSLLGVKQMVVLVNKMDLVHYNQEHFLHIVKEYRLFLEEIGIPLITFIPVSGFNGDNVVEQSKDNMPWYRGKTMLQQLDILEPEKSPVNKPLRMPVQGVYKFTKSGDDRRIIAGTIETGTLTVGDEIVFYPSGKKTRVRSIEAFNMPSPKMLSAGFACGFTMTDQIYITRGEIATKSIELKPKVSTRIRANIFWLGKHSLIRNKAYQLKIGTTKVSIEVEAINKVLDTGVFQYSKKNKVEKNEVAQCVLKLSKGIAFDLIDDIAATSRFVIVDDYDIAGGGIIMEALEDSQQWVREKVLKRNDKWEKSTISRERRMMQYSQKPSLIVITGQKEEKKKELAKALEERLFESGYIVYYMGIGTVLYGVDADIKIESSQENKEEQLRRFAEVVNLMMDAGMVVITSAIDIKQEELAMFKTIIQSEDIHVIWLGDTTSTDIDIDVHLSKESKEVMINKIRTSLKYNN